MATFSTPFSEISVELRPKPTGRVPRSGFFRGILPGSAHDRRRAASVRLGVSLAVLSALQPSRRYPHAGKIWDGDDDPVNLESFTLRTPPAATSHQAAAEQQ